MTLNPPPEVRPLLDRVVVPILELKSREMEEICEVGRIESEKAKMESFLVSLARGEIAVLFVGSKNPEEYLHYVEEGVGSFRGLLVCSRGKFSRVYKELLHERVVDVLKRVLSAREVEVEVFEGVLELEKPVLHYYVLISSVL